MRRDGTSILAAHCRGCPNASCKVVGTAVGKESEDEMSLYQDKTKSRTTRIMISFRLGDTTGMSGHNDGRD